MAVQQIEYTDRAGAVLQSAHALAVKTRHPAVLPEHILLSIISAGEGPAVDILRDLSGISLEEIGERIIAITPAPDAPPLAVPGWTPKAKKALAVANEAAILSGAAYTGPEHLLLGVVSDKGSRIANTLANLVPGIHSRVLMQAEEPGVEDDEYEPNYAPPAATAGARPKGVKYVGPDRGTAHETPGLDAYCRDLSAEAKSGKLDPAIGRDMEVRRILQVLGRRKKNNPVLIGDPGVGKTAIVEALALETLTEDAPPAIKGARIMSLDLGSLLAGAKWRGEFEERLKAILEEAATSPDIVLFIDELHTVVGAGGGGGASGGADMGNLLKPALARGELRLIGATTFDEYRKYIESDAALERRFQPVKVQPPSVEDTIQILTGLKSKYEAYHGVSYSPDALEAAARLSDRYITDRFLPDKAFDLIDEAGSNARLSASDAEGPVVVSADDIAAQISTLTGIPVDRLTSDERMQLQGLEAEMGKRLIGQKAALAALAKAIRRSRAGLKDPNRPVGSFLFLGPTGVGKTEAARTLARTLFHDEQAMVRIDMSEFMEKHATAKLIGAPPGYVGHEEGGKLTEAVRRRPFSVVLLDEVEKAHPDTFNLLLQVLDEGHLTDGRGRRVSFKDVVIIMTSNLGAREPSQPQAAVGFSLNPTQVRQDGRRERMLSAAKEFFAPEFLNRLDETIIFDPLTQDEVGQIARVLIKDVDKRLMNMGLDLDVSEKAISFLVSEGFDPEMGARPLKRAIQRYLEDPLADLLIAEDPGEGGVVQVDSFIDGELAISITRPDDGMD